MDPPGQLETLHLTTRLPVRTLPKTGSLRGFSGGDGGNSWAGTKWTQGTGVEATLKIKPCDCPFRHSAWRIFLISPPRQQSGGKDQTPGHVMDTNRTPERPLR